MNGRGNSMNFPTCYKHVKVKKDRFPLNECNDCVNGDQLPVYAN
ncbi:hypothetical protein LOT_0815 [Lentilactobacillus otakiensis DSM 19908 = JCM 15040]|uniref:Uncharacterized protein n=1 Tax=Lentilactobacillus otakiensis DSM 19908 = JCM 15040 TaxID=1423780 RepID=S4NGA7_9LACO|nr:hypothetical protein LOT_0815 [Lentilactobacillus otakiensis DSM 19908 = JCM 15040]